MATSCSCTDPKFPNLGRPNCVIRRKKVAFPIVVPRYQADGVTRNVIDLTSNTLGADIQALIAASTAVLERLYPFPKVENLTFERTETSYQTSNSGKKYKLDGEGGVRTVAFSLLGDEGTEQHARELQKLGCSQFDVYWVTVDGNLWGVMDDTSVAELRGYAVEAETFDSFLQLAVDGAVNGVMVSFDLEDDDDNVNSYAITSDELGYKATTLRPNISGTCTAVEATTTTITATVNYDFGSAVNSGQSGLLGLVTANFTVTSDTGAVTPITVAEVGDGVYTITHDDADITTADNVTVAVSATGYDIVDGTFVAAL